MSPATDGFSAMMSFLSMPGERAEMISAKPAQLQPGGAFARVRARARTRKSVRQAAVRGAEQILGEQPAGRRLLVPQHHQHDQLELVERQRAARSGERALGHQLARLRVEDARLL